jgi:hypothetical protein
VAAARPFGLPQAGDAGPTAFAETEVKAAFVYNFAHFVRWPEGNMGRSVEPFRYCIFDDTLAALLAKAVAGETLDGRPLVVLRQPEFRNLQECHLIYFGEQSVLGPTLQADVLRRLTGSAILTVSDQPGFAARGHDHPRAQARAHPSGHQHRRNGKSRTADQRETPQPRHLDAGRQRRCAVKFLHLGKYPIKHQVVLIALITTTLGLVVALMLLVYSELQTAARAMQDNAHVLTRLVGVNSTAAVSFQDPEAAQEIINALGSAPDVIAATLRSPPEASSPNTTVRIRHMPKCSPLSRITTLTKITRAPLSVRHDTLLASCSARPSSKSPTLSSWATAK